MNEREYRKQLLIQRIETHRGVMDRELQNLRDANPLNPLFDLRDEITDALSRLGIRVGSSSQGSQGGVRHSGLDFSLVLPLVVQLGSALLRKRKRRH